MVDLQGLMQEKENDNQDDAAVDTVRLLTTGQSNGSKVEYNKLVGAEPVAPAGPEEGNLPSIEIRESTVGESSKSNAGPNRLASRQDSQSSRSSSVEEEKKQDTVHYSGFAADYDGYDYDPYQIHYHNTPRTLVGGQTPSSGSFLCCLFPWLGMTGNDSNSRSKEIEQPFEEEETSLLEKTKTSNDSNGPLRKLSSVGDDDDMSTGELSASSDKLGEKLSEKDRSAVLARLRLGQPDGSLNSPGGTAAETEGSPGSSEKETANKKGLLNDIPNLSLAANDSKSDVSTTSSNGPKGILRRTSVITKATEPQQDSKDGKRRRSLFPSYETKQPGGKKKNENKVVFSPMARVVCVPSQKNMTAEEKGAIWWQRWDYEDFRKTGRIITRAMLEGGSEIWLASNQSWQHLGASKSATLKNAMTLAERGSSPDRGSGDFIRTTGDKWWHKFGHSRRGLEHIATIKEGSERQANVRHAIRAMLDEQRRQKTYLREDPEKLRMICIHNTSWARDLAVAAGQSDADAVNSKFDEGERKSREFYLLKMSHTNSVQSQGKHVPAFMKPALSSFSPKLDAHTSAQIMDRRKQHRHQLSLSSATPSSKKKDAKPPTSVSKSVEPIHDANESGVDLARRAAGFSHPGSEQVNMAAVMSGMGAVPKIAQAV